MNVSTLPFPAACLALALAACSARAPAPLASPPAGDAEGEPVPITRLLASEISGFKEAERLVIEDAVAWRSALERVPGAMPLWVAVDFTRSIVLLAALGEQTSGLHAIEIVAVRRYADRIDAHVRVMRPGSCPAPSVMTQPVAAVAMPRTALPVRFVREPLADGCAAGDESAREPDVATSSPSGDAAASDNR